MNELQMVRIEEAIHHNFPFDVNNERFLPIKFGARDAGRGDVIRKVGSNEFRHVERLARRRHNPHQSGVFVGGKLDQPVGRAVDRGETVIERNGPN